MIKNSLFTAASFTPKSLQFPNAWVGHLPFAAWMIQEVSPKIFVELGTHSGNSYFSFCQSVVEADLSTKCYAVDTWQGDEHAGQYGDEIFAKVNAHHQEHFAGFSRLLRMTFDDALTYFADESIELLHIDGLHTYEAVRHDFETWLPKLAPGAVVIFHDTNVRERNFGVWKLWSELQDQYQNNLEFVHSHGLGVLQLNNAPSSKVLEWLQPNSPERPILINYFAALGSRQLVRYELIELKQHANNLNQSMVERDGQIASLNQSVTERDGQIADLTQAVTERDGQIANLTQTNSWRLTRPLREIRRWLSRPVEQGRIYRAVYMRFPLIRNLRTRYLQFNQRLRQSIYSISHSAQNTPALQNLSEARVLLTTTISQPADNGESPAVPITISVVTFNSGRWIKSFMYSLMSQTYPLELINLRFMDHGSTDDTVTQLVDVTINYKNRFSSIEYAQQSNLGFGAGHDSILRAANTEFCLVTNIDIEFEREAIKVVVKAALADQTCSIASWELRQIPYEHPKFYDPVTQLTNWSSHACILLLRDAYLKVGGYDRAIFMYCEDVELSYRFRSYGYGLRYVPQAVVIHHTYEEAGQVKPLQFYGGALGNYYLRLRYGNFQDRLAGAANYVGKLIHPNGVPGARRTLLSNLGNLLSKTPHFLRGRGPRKAYFPFRGNDYELTREGAFIDIASLRQGICDAQVRPLVSVITRTVQGREILLEQAARSVFNQTYANIEFIVSQDGGEPTNAIIKKLQNLAPSSMKLVFLGNAKKGRSAAGNAALKIAQGNYLIFLDDDDLFFPDHVEVLLGSILKDNSLEGAYSLAFEVQTDMTPNYQNYTEHSWHTPSVFRQPWDYEVLKNHNFMPIQAVLFSRKLYEKWGGFNEELDQLEDWNLWLRFGYKAQFAFIPKTTSIYRTPHDLKVRLARNELLHAAYEAARLDAINTTTLYSQRAELALTVYDQKHSTPPAAVKAL